MAKFVKKQVRCHFRVSVIVEIAQGQFLRLGRRRTALDLPLEFPRCSLPVSELVFSVLAATHRYLWLSVNAAFCGHCLPWRCRKLLVPLELRDFYFVSILKTYQTTSGEQIDELTAAVCPRLYSRKAIRLLAQLWTEFLVIQKLS